MNYTSLTGRHGLFLLLLSVVLLAATVSHAQAGVGGHGLWDLASSLWAGAAQLARDTEVPPPGGALVVNHAGGWGVWPRDDGTITFFEALSYARQDSLPNVIRFHPDLHGQVIDGYVGWYNAQANLSGDGDSILGGWSAPGIKIHHNLHVTGRNNVVRGVCAPLIVLDGARDGKVQACHIGLDTDGTTAWPSTSDLMGVRVESADEQHPCTGNLIGGGLHSERNYFGRAFLGFSGNWTSDNRAVNNYLGMKSDAWTPQAPTLIRMGAVYLENGAHHNQIGNWKNRWNCIVSSTAQCVYLGSGAHHNTVRGNYIQRNNSDFTCRNGVLLEGGAHDNTIGGPEEAEMLPNSISHFEENGILVTDGAYNNRLLGNRIGISQWGDLVTSTGGAALGGQYGINLDRDTRGNRVGGATLGTRNWIAGQSLAGIRVGPRSDTVTITGNWIGFDQDYTTSLEANGILLAGAKGVMVGGLTTPTAQVGNVVGGAGGSAILLKNCTGPVVIQSNTIGLNADRSVVLTNQGHGIEVRGSHSVSIGGSEASDPENPPLEGPPSPARGNTIAHSRDCGVYFGSGTVDGLVLGNRIDSSFLHGVVLDGGGGTITNVVVGPDSAERRANLITNSTSGYGVVVAGRVVHGNRVCGNWIGCVPKVSDYWNWNEWYARPNARGGVLVSEGAYDNAIGLNTAQALNRIGGNGGPGITLEGASHHNRVTASIIGRQDHENLLAGNNGPGILITEGSHHNLIGGDDPLLRNIIAGNRGHGIAILGADSNHNEIRHNHIGVNQTLVAVGTGDPSPCPDGNLGWGVYITGGSQYNVIGAPSATAYSNVISANRDGGIYIAGPDTNAHQIIRNRLGTDPSGMRWKPATQLWPDWGNQGPGVRLLNGSQDNVIGGPNQSYGNQIANNRGEGVRIQGRESINNKVQSNLIGTNPRATAALGNRDDGVQVINAAANTIGTGTFSGANTISGNTGNGVLIEGPYAFGNKVLGNLIGTDGNGDTQATVPGYNKLANGQVGLLVHQGAHHNEITNGNVVSGNAGTGVVIAGQSTDGNILRGNTIGLNRGLTAFAPNGDTMDARGTAVSVRQVLGTGFVGQYGPKDTEVSYNRIYGTRRGIHFSDCIFEGALGQFPNNTRAVGNRIGFLADGTFGTGEIGVWVTECYVYLENNQIRGQNIGVQSLGMHAYTAFKNNTFSDNRKHVMFAQNSKGLLGKTGETRSSWKWGGNVFGASSTYAVDCYEAHSNFVIYGQNCDWGSYTRASIEARINWRNGDTTHTDFVYDPILGGLHPTLMAGRTGEAVVSGLTASAGGAGGAISFTLSAPAMVTVEVANIAGRLVRTLATARPGVPGLNTLVWDGRSDRGLALPAGPYRVTVTACDTEGGRSVAHAMAQLQR